MIAGSVSRPRVAAFFDVDGTLVPGPSLERRFFFALRRRGAIPTPSYFASLAHAFCLAPRGIETMLRANKMYLRGVSTSHLRDTAVPGWARVHRSETRVGGEQPKLIPSFFPGALSQVAWHGLAGHAIVLVTGTLAPLAHRVAVALTMSLAARGCLAPVGVCATRLEEIDGRWTGRIVGEAMFGQAKARAVRRLVTEEGFDLRRCYAYGDTSSDRWMLSAVGRPAAVNPSRDLERVARLNDWPVLRWSPAKAGESEATESRSTLRYNSFASQ